MDAPVIEVKELPRNAAHVRRLVAFGGELLAVCHALGIHPVLDSSLAVFAHTRDTGLDVHDVDFACNEDDFPRLKDAFEQRGVACRITDYHVLRADRGDLQAHFGAIEHWSQGVDMRAEPMRIGGVVFLVQNAPALTELYRRGWASTAPEGDSPDPRKHRAYGEKHRLLAARVSQGINPGARPGDPA